MTLFNENMKMADLIHQNYLLLSIINRFNIQLGFGDKTIHEVCVDHGINTEFFLVIVNSFHNHDFFPQQKLLRFPLKLILDYIRNSHRFYLSLKVPQIEKLIHSLIENSGEQNKKQVYLIEKFFGEYKAELAEHILDEDDNIFPYVIALDNASDTGAANEKLLHQIKNKPIRIYADEHTNIEDKLFDLKNIIIKYLPPAPDSSIANTLLIELFRLERDLNDHARIEEKVLVPKVEALETALLKSEK